MTGRTPRGIALALALLLNACGGENEPPAFDTDGGIDFPDAGIGDDGGAGQDGGASFGPGFAATPGIPVSDGAGEPDDAGRATCYDELDNDADRAVDCAEPSCQALRSCCVDAGGCCGEPQEAALPANIDFTACAAGAGVETCLVGQGASGTSFGTPAPRIEAGGLAPGGDARFDSGVVLDRALDLRARRVVLRATLVAADGCGDSCLEGVGVGLTPQTVFDDTTTVSPLVGFAYAASRSQVAFLLGGETASHVPLPADGSVRLEVEPSGQVRGYVGAGSTAAVWGASFAPQPAARLVAYGRNRADVDGARLASLEVDEGQCDMPRAWAERVAITVRDPITATEATLGPAGSPSLAYDPAGVAWVAFEEARATGDVIRWARRTEAPNVFELADVPGGPALAPGANELHVRDPELVWSPADGGWVMLHTSVGTDGVERIGRAVAGAADGAFVADAEPAVEPSELGVAGLADPAVARREDGAWAVLVVARGSDAPSWWLLRSSDADRGRNPVPIDGVPPFAPPEDDATEPGLLVHGGAWRIPHGRTGGTRPDVGLLASDELLYFRRVRDGGAVLEGSGASFDRLGVLAPDAVSVGDAIEMVYLGFDGVRVRLGIARRQAHPAATF